MEAMLAELSGAPAPGIVIQYLIAVYACLCMHACVGEGRCQKRKTGKEREKKRKDRALSIGGRLW